MLYIFKYISFYSFELYKKYISFKLCKILIFSIKIYYVHIIYYVEMSLFTSKIDTRYRMRLLKSVEMWTDWLVGAIYLFYIRELINFTIFWTRHNCNQTASHRPTNHTCICLVFHTPAHNEETAISNCKTSLGTLLVWNKTHHPACLYALPTKRMQF